MKYRMYVDEVGNSDLGASRDPNHRYLSLTGVIMELNYVAESAAPAVEALKAKYFGAHHPDEPVILHRKEMVNHRPPFQALADDATRQSFNTDLLQLMEETPFVAITVVIDKLDHARRYVWAMHPYHYCMTALMERYAMWLNGQSTVGDVMAESRGKKDDVELKTVYRTIYEQGTDFMSAKRMAQRLTSRELKVKPKASNIAGLQLADMLAHPSLVATAARVAGNPVPENFGGRIAAILEKSKYRRRANDGFIWGRGRVWIPKSAQPKA